MFLNIKKYLRPLNIDEAYGLLQSKNAVIIGGGAFLNLGNREVETAIDLSKLNLNFIEEKNGEFLIGAMTTLRKLETSSFAKENFDGVITKTLSCIMGVQLRNTATIGGSVYGRYGFSDIITTFLALDAEVELCNGGKMSLEKFLEEKIDRDILLKISIKKDNRKAAYINMRNSSADFSLINVAVAMKDNRFRICVGARPKRAKVAYEAMSFINSSEVNEETALRAGEIASTTLQFGGDIRASAEYRKELCKALVKRAIMEVIQ